MQRCVKVAAWVYGSGIVGHVSTEDVSYLLNGLGIDSDVDLDKSAEIGVWITQNIWQAESVKGGLGAGG